MYSGRRVQPYNTRCIRHVNGYVPEAWFAHRHIWSSQQYISTDPGQCVCSPIHSLVQYSHISRGIVSSSHNQAGDVDGTGTAVGLQQLQQQQPCPTSTTLSPQPRARCACTNFISTSVIRSFSNSTQQLSGAHMLPSIQDTPAGPQQQQSQQMMTNMLLRVAPSSAAWPHVTYSMLLRLTNTHHVCSMHAGTPP
jgi:hypothetical protein